VVIILMGAATIRTAVGSILMEAGFILMEAGFILTEAGIILMAIIHMAIIRMAAATEVGQVHGILSKHITRRGERIFIRSPLLSIHA
jgi:hypothetical protein